MKNNILVLGGTGKTGRRVVQKLQSRKANVTSASRSTTPPFDWENAVTWEKVLEGTDQVYITFQPDLAVPGALDTLRNFTELAKKSGVKKLILLSGRGEKEAQEGEQVVIRSGMEWTIVRASWFNQNFSESFFLEPVQAGFLALPRAEALEPFIDADDIADVVVESLLNDKHSGQVYELTGPELLTFPQATDIIAKATGREIHFQAISIEEYTNTLKEFGVPDGFIWLVDYLFTQVLDGRNASITHDVEKVLGRKPKSFAEFAIETAKTGIWNH